MPNWLRRVLGLDSGGAISKPVASPSEIGAMAQVLPQTPTASKIPTGPKINEPPVTEEFAPFRHLRALPSAIKIAIEEAARGANDGEKLGEEIAFLLWGLPFEWAEYDEYFARCAERRSWPGMWELTKPEEEPIDAERVLVDDREREGFLARSADLSSGAKRALWDIGGSIREIGLRNIAALAGCSTRAERDEVLEWMRAEEKGDTEAKTAIEARSRRILDELLEKRWVVPAEETPAEMLAALSLDELCAIQAAEGLPTSGRSKLAKAKAILEAIPFERVAARLAGLRLFFSDSIASNLRAGTDWSKTRILSHTLMGELYRERDLRSYRRGGVERVSYMIEAGCPDCSKRARPKVHPFGGWEDLPPFHVGCRCCANAEE